MQLHRRTLGRMDTIQTRSSIVAPRGLPPFSTRMPRARLRCLGHGAEGSWGDVPGANVGSEWDAHSLHPQGPSCYEQGISGVGFPDQMSLDIIRFQAFEAYKRELSLPSEQVDLLKCATLIARATCYPHAEVVEVEAQVSRLAHEVEKQLGDVRYPLHVIRTIISVMYHQKGFHGNTIDFYDPDNSFINAVLQNKAGIPITLSLLFMEVARRVGLPMKGVNLPAHFMIQPDVVGLEVLVDAYAGEVLFLEDAAAKLSSLLQFKVTLDAHTVLNRKGVPPRQFLLRMLNNLKQIYLMTNKVDMALRVIRLMRVTAPDAAPEMRDEGLCLYSLGRYQEAADALAAYMAASPEAEDALMIRTVVEGCQVLMREQAQERREQEARNNSNRRQAD